MTPCAHVAVSLGRDFSIAHVVRREAHMCHHMHSDLVFLQEREATGARTPPPSLRPTAPEAMPAMSEQRWGNLIESSRESLRIFQNVARLPQGPGARTEAVALLIWFLSGSPSLATVYLQSRAVLRLDITAQMLTSTEAALTLLGWFKNDKVRALVLAAVDSLDHPVRHRADVFLMQTCLVELIITQNHKGLTVDLPQAIQAYLRLWSYRPMSERTGRALRNLVWHRNCRRRFGVLLRRNFIWF